MDANEERPGAGIDTLSSVDRLALFVLGRMLASRDTLARRKALARVDPLLRAAVVRRMDSALDDAVRVAPDLDESHRRRLAILDILDNSPPFDRARDLALVRSLHDASAPSLPTSAGPWKRSLAWLLALCVLVGAAVVYLALRERPYAALEPTGASQADAYRHGGRPRSDAHVRRALSVSLPGLTAAATAEALQGRPFAPELVRIRGELSSKELTDALGPDASYALRRLVAVFADQVAGRSDLSDVRAAVARLDDALVARGLAYRVHPMDLGTTTLGLLTFEIREVQFRRAGDHRVLLLLADRLDPLNVESTILGFVARDSDVIIVPVDRAEVIAATVLTPLLENPPFPALISPRVTMQRLPWLEPAHASAHVLVEREVGPRRCGRQIETTVALLAERRRLVLEWSDLLISRGGVEVAQPAGYRIDLERWRRFESVNPRFRAFERVYAQLGERPNASAIACVRDRMVESTLHGLAQRYVDLRRQTPIPLHASLLPFASNDLVQGTTHGSMDGTVLATRASLAAIAGDAHTPGIALTMLLRCWTDGGRCNRDTENAARIVFGELGRELAVPDVREPQFLRAVDLARIYRALAERDDTALARGANATFVRLFGDAPIRLR